MLSVKAINDFLWDAEPYLDQPADQAMKAYLEKWYGEQFSPSLASELAALRLHYYDIPYLREKMPEPFRWRGARGEHLLQHMTQELLKRYGDAVEKGEDVSKSEQFPTVLKQAKGPLVETAQLILRPPRSSEPLFAPALV